MEDDQDLKRRWPLGLTLLIFTGAVAVFVIFIWWEKVDEVSAADGIVIVAAPNVAVHRPAPAATATASGAVEVASTPEIAIDHVEQAYPLLLDVTLNCELSQCVLTGTIRPPDGQDDVDKRQEMLLGGLKAVLAADGYDMLVPFQMDEVDDNQFHIRASMIRAQRDSL